MFGSLFEESLEFVEKSIENNDKESFHSSLEEYALLSDIELSHMKLSELIVDIGLTVLEYAMIHNAGEMIEYFVEEGCSYGLMVYPVLKSKGFFELMERFFPSRGVCSICYEEADFYFLHNCYHSFCEDCLESWVTSNVTSYHFQLKCPDRDCECDFDAQDVLNFLPTEELKTLYLEKTFEITLISGNGFLFCPNCEEPGWNDSRPGICATCHSCEHSFCPTCKKNPHKGWTCFEWEQMADIKDDDDYGLSLFWISKRSKACPQCKTAIQKNGGCSHMTCGTCQYQFCWICGRKYTPGSYVFSESNCNCPTTINPEDKYFELIPFLWNKTPPIQTEPET